MAEYGNSKDNKNRRFLGSLRESKGSQRDKARSEIVAKELEEFNKLIVGHKKLLAAIGSL